MFQNNSNLLSHNSRGQTSKIKVLAGLCSLWRLWGTIHPSFLQLLVLVGNLQHSWAFQPTISVLSPTSSCVIFIFSFLCVCVSLCPNFSLNKDSSHMGLEPTLMTFYWNLITSRTILVVQWLELQASTRSWIWSWVREIRSHMPHGATKNK